MAKTALIVDDSAVARHTLSKLLMQHDLVPDTANSAEEALDYLMHKRPDVVFMDHMMPGMDGFEALESIKANPATATIPVMMYTSQEGELYVGQARALGAFGVLPKELKPLEVARVLRALRLIPGERSTDPRGVPSAVSTAAQAGDSPDQSRRVAALLEELFRQQRLALREEIQDGYERALADTQQLAVLPERASKEASPRLLAWAAGILFVTTLGLGVLNFQARDRLQDLTTQSIVPAENGAPAGADSATPAAPPAAAVASDFDPIEALQWAVNLSGRYGFADLPMDDVRALALSRLIEFLEQAGFTGTILLQVHVGRFCMDLADDGTLQLAPADRLARDCFQLGWPDFEAETMGLRQSLVFANTLTAQAAPRGSIAVDIVSFGSLQPEIDYPLMTDYLSAGDWNAVAQINHRVEISLLGDADAAASEAFSASSLGR